MKCPVCLENEVETQQNVDVYSDDTIPCCLDCSRFLAKMMRHQWYGDAKKSWLKANEDKIERAGNALHEIYDQRWQQRRP